MTDLFLTAGCGPQECAWALGRLLPRLEADAARRGLRAVRVETVPGERPGTYRSALVRITGTGAEEFAGGWTGTLCWQAASPYRPGHGRKNWYVTARPHRTDVVDTPFHEADVEMVPCRTGGPGGQHRNKASTAVRATHRPPGLTVVVDTERHLHLNRRIAVDLLRRRVAEGDEAARRAGTTARWRIHDELVRGDPVRVERP
ncbi:peptide chain release factor H [Micromonospora sp. WMMD980]|uniref:peptide chain release factor H n=1 Tax=Micromonospora sp. WMMD980 TaxID=3016088 RepID=UPI002416A116|nr:peptide chain release factor H [Micromonospora sp. WMMD980]MDG4801902.1 peptide chain release factor H [Micromonospora sp. WMMD980]